MIKKIINKISRKISKSYKVNKLINYESSLLSKAPLFNKALRNMWVKKHLQFPTRIEIELTNFCNAKCVKCANSTMKREKGHMDIDLMNKIIDECNNNYVERIHFSGYGEPLLYQKFTNVVNDIRKKKPDIEIVLFSNGEVLTPEKAEPLLSCGLDRINISFDGTTKETYEKNTGMKFERTKSNVRNLLTRKKKMHLKKPFVALQFNELYLNTQKQEFEDFQNIWKGLADSMSVQSYGLWAGGVEDKLNVRERASMQRPCYKLWELLVIRWNGEVSICNVDYDNTVSIGNINENTIKEIWSGSKMKNIRQAHMESRYNEIPVCSRCVVRKSDLPAWWW